MVLLRTVLDVLQYNLRYVRGVFQTSKRSWIILSQFMLEILRYRSNTSSEPGDRTEPCTTRGRQLTHDGQCHLFFCERTPWEQSPSTVCPRFGDVTKEFPTRVFEAVVATTLPGQVPNDGSLLERSTYVHEESAHTSCCRHLSRCTNHDRARQRDQERLGGAPKRTDMWYIQLDIHNYPSELVIPAVATTAENWS